MIQQGQCHEEVHLHEAPSVGDDVVLCLDVDQHLWDNGAEEAGVNVVQFGQEEGCRGVQMRVRANGQDDEQFPCTVTRYMTRRNSNSRRSGRGEMLVWFLN